MAADITSVVLAAGALTAANEALFAPLTGHGTPWSNLNWKLLPATAGLALALNGLGALAPGFAKGLAWLTLVGALVLPVGNAPTPIQNVNSLLGYGK